MDWQICRIPIVLVPSALLAISVRIAGPVPICSDARPIGANLVLLMFSPVLCDGLSEWQLYWTCEICIALLVSSKNGV